MKKRRSRISLDERTPFLKKLRWKKDERITARSAARVFSRPPGVGCLFFSMGEGGGGSYKRSGMEERGGKGKFFFFFFFFFVFLIFLFRRGR